MAANDSDMNIISILTTLQSKISSKDDRIKAYTNFSNLMKEDDLSLFNMDVAKNADQIWSVLQQDIMSDQSLVAHSALQVLGFFLHDIDNVRNLSVVNVETVIPALKECVSKTEDKTTCTRALWCLGQQNLSTDVVNKNVDVMLDSAEFAMEKWKAQSITVENEASNIISRLLEVCPTAMNNHIARWGRILLQQLVHTAIKIREKALEVVTIRLSSLMTEQKVLAKFVTTDFNKKFGAEMERLFGSRHEVHVLKTWGILIQILGDELHRGSFINHVLPIAELGFKSSNTEVKSVTFQAWQQLIDNFATNNSILTDPKRIKLVMQVFKLNNAKSESVALVKLQVWWHFIWLLGPKASVHFDQVCVPLLHFCLGGGKLNNHMNGAATPRGLKNGTSPITPQMNLSTLGSSSAPPVIPSLQLKGCEILAHILGNLPNDIDFPRPSYTVDPLSHEIITGPSSFYKHANLLVNSTAEVICTLSNKIPEALLYQIWYSLLAHMKNALEHLKTEMREILTSFLTQFQVIILSQALPHKVLLKMFEVVCCLPRKSLTSTAYNVGNGERIHGTPALFLTELLLTPVLLSNGTVSESYMTLFGILVDCGISTSSGSLEFCHSTVRMLEQNKEFVVIPEMMWRLWSGLVNPLHEHIKKTNEVNQGDALEHNFNSLYAVLMFPVQQSLVTSMPQASVKTMLKSWCDLYKTFARLSALVSNAEPNICCEELCQRVLKLTTDDHVEEVGYLDFVSQCCLSMVNAVDFSSLGAAPSFNLNGLSPAKWAKKKQKPMDNIQSLVILSKRILEATLTMATKGDSGKKPGVGSIHNTAAAIVEVLTHLFTHINTSSVILPMIGQLAQPIADLLQGSAGKTTSKIYTSIFQQKVEKLWQTLTNSVQNKFTSKADSVLLATLSPMLEATFLHPRRAMKNITTNFWKTEFSQSAPLVYPESLKPVLCKVKEKSSIVLPGWSAVSISVVEETPVSQMSQAESQAPEPRLPGMPSPVKMHGSFLNKAVSPHIKKSPAKPVAMETKAPEIVKRDLLSVSGMKNDDFVVIKSPLKKKRVLTEHQKEVFREKKSFPAMYNSLDLSQDVSMMSSQFGNENTQNESQLPSLDSVIVIDSSASQVSQSNTQQDGSMKETRREESKSDTKLMKQPGKIRRRRSVRFRDSDKQDEVDSIQPTSVDDIESRSINHFSCDPASNGQTENAEETVEKSSLGEEDILSSAESAVTPSLPQNPLGVIGLFEQLSSKSFSLDSKKSDHSSSPKNDEEELKTSDTPSSEPLLSWSNKLTALSQSPLSTSQRQIRSSASADKLLEHPPSSQEENSSSPIKKSPQKSKGTESSGQVTLDKWFNQPAVSQGVGKEVVTDSVQSSNVVTVIEETQSPAKLGFKEQNPVKESSPDHGSPARLHRQAATRGSHKKLFGGDTGKEIEDFTEDSNIIPASPKQRSKFSGKVGTPVLKLKRLTDDEIKQFSPTRKNSTQSSPSGKYTSQNRETEGGDQNSGTVDELHEHDDFSEIRPLDSEDVIPSSQGFTTLTGGVEKSDQSHLQSSGFKKACVVNPVEKDKKLPVTTHASVLDIEIDTADPEWASLTENLFTESMDTVSYDPGLDSTFKESTLATPKIFDTRNCNETEKEENVQTDSAETQEPITSVCEDKSYNPKEISTMASDAPTPGRGRKRKQTSPVHMSPDNIKRKRTRKVPKKYLDSDEITSEVDTKVKRTPKSGTPRLLRNPKRNAQSTTETEEEKNGPIQVKVDIHTTPDKKAECAEDSINSKVDENKQVNESQTTLNISDLDQKLQKGANEITEHVLSKNSDITATEDKELSDEISKEMLDELDRNPDLEELNGEKTPEGRSSRSTPYRKSTTKTKKEVVQKRARQMEKTIIINSGISNLDSESSEDDTCVGKIPKASETQDQGSQKISPAVEPLSDTSSQGTLKPLSDTSSQGSLKNIREFDSDGLGHGDSLSNSDAQLTASKGNEKALNNEKDVCSELETGNTIQDCIMDSDSNIHTSDIPEKEDVMDDEPLSLLKSNKEDSAQDKIITFSDDDDDVPLSQIKSLSRKNGDLRKESEIEQDDIVDLTKSQDSKDSNEKKSSKKIGERKTLTRSQASVTRSGTKRRSPLRKARDNKNLSLKKNSRQRSLPSKKDNSEKVGKEDVSNCPSRGNKRDVQNKNMVVESDNVQNKNMEVESDNVQNKNMEVESDNIQNKNMEVESDNVQNKNMEVESDNNNDKTFKSVESPIMRKEKELDVTPRKIPDKSFVPTGCTLFESHSDSKLISASRKFNKTRHIVARRSILKQPSPSQNSTDESSPITGKGKRFHPIRVGHVHSPSASPSAGILKKQRLSGDIVTNSPSPPGKRRVCFAHPLTVEQEAINLTDNDTDPIKTADSMKSPSPLVTSSRVTFSSEKYFTVPVIMSPSAKHIKKSLPLNPSPKVAASFIGPNGNKESQLTQSQTQSSYRSTQESQLNCTDPIYPELLECSDKVDKILPQLTTSMWMRGLGQLVRARNIHTIGDLSALTEREVDNLPIKSPKVSIVRSVLQKFGTQMEARKVKNEKQDAANTMKKAPGVDIPEEEGMSPVKKPGPVIVLESLDVEVIEMKEEKGDGDNLPASSKSMSIDGDYTDSLQSITNTSNLENATQSTETSTSAAGSLLQSLEDIVRQCNDKTKLSEFKTADIFQMHHHLTNLTASFMSELKDRCKCPDA
ncbi:LOW QUALITY PROTEIN: telomere-associated protein RIF1-like [Pecten maximus]|uniref:LOW QUALITY PROTEIN: telomere-associated protein RIF1-like n=1 Tax=Pecten maximus TaxID=6579 RepID=UPI00145902D2|nr:LOW QUALITY PROTEIN: telomere-associated protein RIF1-like [Pecten maximus]